MSKEQQDKQAKQLYSACQIIAAVSGADANKLYAAIVQAESAAMKQPKFSNELTLEAEQSLMCAVRASRAERNADVISLSE